MSKAAHRLQVPYRRYGGFRPTPADPSSFCYRPALEVRVIGLSDSISLWGIVDTGATECVLPFQIFDHVEPTQRNDDRGELADAGGTTRVHEYGTVDLEIITEAGPLRWSAKVAFDRQRPGEALWGHVGFLQYFNANFNGPGRCFSLRLKGPRPPIGIIPTP